MTWVNRRFGISRAAGTISAVLLGTILVAAAGSSALGSAYGQMADGSGNTSSSVTAQGAETGHAFRGQISSVQLDDEGNPSWIQSGIWVMRILQAGDGSEPPQVQLVARFVMVMPNGNAMHSHNMYDFDVENYTVDEEAMTHTFEGTATVTMPDGPVSGVPLTVTIFNNAVVAVWIGPEMIDSHFGEGPVYGVLSSASRDLIERIDVGNLGGNNTSDEPVPSTEVEIETVNYYGDASGYLAQPAESEDQLPAVVMIHEWWGLNENIKNMAEQLAGEGYVVLAVDLYDGEVATESSQARTLATSVRENPDVAVENLNAAVAHLSNLKNVDSSRIASLGWCFGGGFSLQLALNAEQPLAATVVYYGTLVTDEQELASITWPVLGIFGAEDQSIPVEDVNEFEASLDANGIMNEIYIYDGVGHAFANPSGDSYAPEETADAWEKTLGFLSTHV